MVISTRSPSFSPQFILQVIGNGLLLLGVLVLILRESLLMEPVLTGFVMVVLVVLIYIRSAAVPQWKKARQASADFFGFLEERLTGTEEIRSSRSQGICHASLFELLRTFWQTTVRARLLAFAMVNLDWLLFSVGMAASFGMSAYLYQAGTMTLGTVYLVVHYIGLLNRPVQRIAQEIEQLQQAGAGVARIQEFLAGDNRLAPPSRERLLP